MVVAEAPWLLPRQPEEAATGVVLHLVGTVVAVNNNHRWKAEGGTEPTARLEEPVALARLLEEDGD